MANREEQVLERGRIIRGVNGLLLGLSQCYLKFQDQSEIQKFNELFYEPTLGAIEERVEAGLVTFQDSGEVIEFGNKIGTLCGAEIIREFDACHR